MSSQILTLNSHSRMIDCCSHTTNVTKLCQFQDHSPHHHENNANFKTIRHTYNKIMPIPRPLATPPILQNFANSKVIIHITNVTSESSQNGHTFLTLMGWLFVLALVYGVYCEFVTFPLVSWVRCGT